MSSVGILLTTDVSQCGMIFEKSGAGWAGLAERSHSLARSQETWCSPTTTTTTTSPGTPAMFRPAAGRKERRGISAECRAGSGVVVSTLLYPLLLPQTPIKTPSDQHYNITHNLGPIKYKLNLTFDNICLTLIQINI